MDYREKSSPSLVENESSKKENSHTFLEEVEKLENLGKRPTFLSNMDMLPDAENEIIPWSDHSSIAPLPNEDETVLSSEEITIFEKEKIKEDENGRVSEFLNKPDPPKLEDQLENVHRTELIDCERGEDESAPYAEKRREEGALIASTKKPSIFKLIEIDAPSYESLKRKSTLERKTSNPRSSSFSEKTSAEVLLRGNESSKKSSRADSSSEQQSTNDPSSEETSSKVSPRANTSSVKLLSADSSQLIIPDTNNLQLIATTLPSSSSMDRNLKKPIDTLHVMDAKNLSESCLGDISHLDFLGTSQITVDPILSEQQNQNRAEDSAGGPAIRKKSVLNVVSKLSMEKDGDFENDSQPKNDCDNIDDKRLKTFSNYESSKSWNKLEDTSIASLNSIFKQSRDTSKLNGFMEDLKHSSQEKDNSESPKIRKTFVKLLRKMSSKNSSIETSRERSNDDLPPESKNSMNYFEMSRSSVEMGSRKEMKEIAGKINEDIPRKPGPSQSQEILESVETTIQNSVPNFIEKPDSVIIGYLVEPSIQDQPEAKSFSSNFNSGLKLSERSEPEGSIANSESPENESLYSLKSDKTDAPRCEIEDDREQSIHFTSKSAEIPLIESMKSLQDERKRSKNRRRAGHKLFDTEDNQFVTENLVARSYAATTAQRDFIRRRNGEETKEVGVHDKSHGSEESVDELNSQTLSTDEEKVEQLKDTKISYWRKKFQKKEIPEPRGRKSSLSRIFSHSFKKKNIFKESRATAISRTNTEEHFEITRIPLSSSDDPDTRGNDSNKIIQNKIDMTDDNREEIVAIKSFDSGHDSENQITKRESGGILSSRRVLHSKCDANTSNCQLLHPGESGTFIYSADSSNNVREVEKLEEKIYVAKGTTVSYAPLVESAKYLLDEVDNRSNEDNQFENHRKRSSGRSFDMIRKLFSRGSIRTRQDPVAVENRSFQHTDQAVKTESEKSSKYSIKKWRKDAEHSEQESIISGIIIPIKSVMDDKDENRERKNWDTVEQKVSKSKVNDPLVHDGVLLVNKNVSIISRNENHDRDSLTSPIEDLKRNSKEEGLLSRSLKRLFKKRNSVSDSVASNNYLQDSSDYLNQLNAQTLNDPANDDTPELLTKEKSDHIQFAVYTVNSRMKFPAVCERLEDENIRDRSRFQSTIPSLANVTANKSEESLQKAALQCDQRLRSKYKSTNEYTEIELSADSDTHIAINSSMQMIHEIGFGLNQDETVAENQTRSKVSAVFLCKRNRPQSRSKEKSQPSVQTSSKKLFPQIASKDFRPNPSFANRRSTVVMMATPIQPREEPNNSDHSRDHSTSNSPTAFYYLLGPSLDEALVDVRVAFQNLIDKITGRGR